MFFAACAFAVLCLVSSSLACPLTCDALTRPARRQDLPPLYGEWISNSLSLRINHRTSPTTKISESFTLHYNNATFLTTKRQDGVCINQPYTAPLRGVDFDDTLRSRDDVQGVPGSTTFRGTIYPSPCADCLVMTFDISSPTYSVETLGLYSKRRQATIEELRKFNALVSCLKYPMAQVLDPTIELCPVTVEGFYGSNSNGN